MNDTQNDSNSNVTRFEGVNDGKLNRLHFKNLVAGFRYPFLFFTNIKRIRIEWVAHNPIGSMYAIYAKIWGYIDGKCYHI